MNSDVQPAGSAGVDPALDPARLPAHVAIIMDGNGRWARRRLLNRVRGHRQGVEVVRTMVRTCHDLGIAYLTLYAFSTENWQRPRTEVNALMGLLERFLREDEPELQRNRIRLNAIGQVDRLPGRVRRTLDQVMTRTRANRDMQLNLALSYGGRSELVAMARQLAAAAAGGRIRPEEIDEAMVGDCLTTRGMPDPDLLIRTSGEMRVSNFLLWQIAYTELFVTDTLWPDFSRAEFLAILQAYQRRQRRFGRV